MKKNFKFMLVALLALFGFNSAFAQAVNDVFESGNYKFKITKVANAQGNGGTVEIQGLTEEAKISKNSNGDEPYITFSGSGESKKGVLEFPGTATHGGVTYKVTTMASETFKDVAYYATEVTIPASLTAIPEAAFNTLTNLKKIEFASESQVKKIGKQAFASTRITEFDFTNCEELEGLNDEVFVERCTPEQRNANNGLNPNENSYITKVTLPTSPKFKHINGAFRNLTELTEIEHLSESWIQEIAPMAFAKTKLGMSEDKPLVLPEKDLLYIDQVALKGSKVAYLEIKMGSVLYVGGCTVAYVQEANGEYTYTYTAPLAAAAETNLYGINGPTKATEANWGNNPKAPLVKLSLTGTQRGKICTNAFLGCVNLDGLDLTNLNYGSKAQFETSAFEYCKKITALSINPLANNETDGYTFEANAFKDCPIVTLTMASVNTAKAVNEKAFGEALKTVTIGTVDATGAENAPAFATGAFTFGAVSGATLSLAAGQGQFLNSKDAKNAIIAAGAFNFQNVRNANNPTLPIVTIGEIKSKGAVFAASALAGPVQKISFVGPIARNGLTVGGDDATPAGVKILNESYGLEIQGDAPASVFKTLEFGQNATIETNGIGSGAFADFDKLETVTFNGLLSELAVASTAFNGSGKVANARTGEIGSKAAPFVKYTVTGIQNWAVNPFACDAFTGVMQTQEAGNAVDRVIWWQIDDPTLRAEILGAIQKAIYADEYVGKEYSTKFNVFKWVDIEYVAPDPDEAPHFLFFQDNSENGNNKIAWGRYDLGSFAKEKGKYSVLPETNPKYIPAYTATNMVIPRYQETTGAKVKLTLYGLYWDEDAFEEVSTTYLVPLRVVNGTYQISADNAHLIIGKAEIQEGTFSDKDVKIYFNNVQVENFPENPTWADWKAEWKVANGTVAAGTDQVYNEANNAVWNQLINLTQEGDACRVYKKATQADAKTHQELYDAVVRYESNGEATNVTTKDLWVMTDPAKYKGFRVDKNPVTKDNYTFIGVDWYYALLNNYKKINQNARVIWLDEAQATAIFGVKDVNVKEALHNGAIYNLQGVRVNGTQKGIYIQNGKKFVVK